MSLIPADVYWCPRCGDEIDLTLTVYVVDGKPTHVSCPVGGCDACGIVMSPEEWSRRRKGPDGTFHGSCECPAIPRC